MALGAFAAALSLELMSFQYLLAVFNFSMVGKKQYTFYEHARLYLMNKVDDGVSIGDILRKFSIIRRIIRGNVVN